MMFKDTLLFPSGGRSNYRIPSVVADSRGNFYAFCNDRRGTLSDAAGEVFLCFARKRADRDWEDPVPLIAVEGWATTMGSAVYDPACDTVMCCGDKIPVQRREFGHYSAAELAAYEAEAERKAAELGILRGPFVLCTSDGGEIWEERPHVIEPRAFTHTAGRRILLGGS